MRTLPTLAALVTVTVLAGAASGAAPSWVPPIAVAAGVSSQVALDGRGDAIVLLGSGGAVRAVFRPAGGRLRAPVDISMPNVAARALGLAMNEEGDAAAVWADGNEAFAAVRAGTGRFEPRGGYALGPWADAIRSGPVVALDARGDATVVWGSGSYPNFAVEAATRPAGGSWTQPETISTPETQPIGLALAVDPKGNAIVAWTKTGDTGVGIETAFRPAGGGWEAPRELSAANASYGSPQVALSSSGDGIVAWECCFPSSRIEAARFSMPSRTSQPPEDVSPPGVAAEAPQLALDAKGDALAVWYASSSSVVQAATGRPGGHFGAPRFVGRGISGAQLVLATNARGDAIVAWQRGSPSFFQASDIQAAVRPANRVFEPAATMPGSIVPPAVAVDGQGNGIVVWTLPSEGKAVQAAGFDAAGPQLRSLHVPPRGEVGTPFHFAVSPVDVWSGVASTRWSFGDGGRANGRRLLHVYRHAGRYRVTVTSTDRLGKTTRSTRTVQIIPRYAP